MERRRAERKAVELQTTCRVPATPQKMKVTDVSKSGCRIEKKGHDVRPGHSVVVNLPDGSGVPGEVMWASHSELGVRFGKSLRGTTAQTLGLEPPPEEERLPIADSEPAERPAGLGHWYRKVAAQLAPSKIRTMASASSDPSPTDCSG